MWGISGGFVDLATVIIKVEAGRWRGYCMIGRMFEDQEKPKSVKSKATEVISLALQGNWTWSSRRTTKN